MVLFYGVLVYVIFLGTFLYAIGFLANFLVPKGIDSGTEGPIAQAIIVNMLLLSLFAIQHSVMARRGFKEKWTQFVPKPAERSTYVLASSLALILLFWLWQPMTGVIWNFEGAFMTYLLWGGYAFGWVMVLYATFLIDHFDLFGLRQVWLYWRGEEYAGKQFMKPGPYKFIRHPLYIGWFCTFWFTPHMTTGHLLFAAVASAYILVAIQLEERDLMHFLGDAYKQYREETPMLIPFVPKKPKQSPPHTPETSK